MPPRRSTRVASVSLETPVVESLPTKRKRGQTLEPHNIELQEDDDIVETKPKRGKRGTSVVNLSRLPRQSSRAATASLETAHVESLPPSKASLQNSDDEIDAMPLVSEKEEDEDNLKPIRKGRKVLTARKTKATANKKLTKTTVIEDPDDDPDTQPPPIGQPPLQHNEAADAAYVASNDMRPMPAVEEEEQSLFDPPPMPEPPNFPREIQEPAGPKSRLVIHKMVLVNFKSYAGRQEIGPFHKVINIRQPPAIKVDLFDAHSRSLPLWVPMDRGNPIPSMLSYLYSDTAPRR